MVFGQVRAVKGMFTGEGAARREAILFFGGVWGGCPPHAGGRTNGKATGG